MEHWLPVKNFDNYLASDHGRIKSCLYRKPKILKGTLAKGGYLRVGLYKNKKVFYKYIHILVSEAFNGPKPENMQCCHLDGDPKNNRLSNLAYGSAKLNQSHRRIHGTACFGEKHPMRKLKKADILKIRNMHVKYSKRYGARYFAKKYGVHEGTIGRIVKFKIWKSLC